jgi:hypothetical protein
MQPLYNCSTARFDGSARALSNDEMKRAAPSIFATAAHQSRSDRFRPIATIQVLDGLRGHGFLPVACRQATVREPGREPFTKHLIRLRRLDDQATYSVGDTVGEIILKNANDGTAAYELMSGLFRIRCLNSLVVQTRTIDTLKVRHSGDVAAKVIEGTWHVLDETRKALAAPRDWAQIPVTADQREAFAEAAHVLRFGDADGNVDTPIQPRQLLLPRRREDAGADVWTTYNVVQENCIRGGLSATRIDPSVRRGRRRVTSRAVNGIDQDVRLNKALFVLAERLAQLAA